MERQREAHAPPRSPSCPPERDARTRRMEGGGWRNWIYQYMFLQYCQHMDALGNEIKKRSRAEKKKKTFWLVKKKQTKYSTAQPIRWADQSEGCCHLVKKLHIGIHTSLLRSLHASLGASSPCLTPPQRHVEVSGASSVTTDLRWFLGHGLQGRRWEGA